LKTVFDLPEEFVGAGEFLKIASADVIFVMQLLQSKECSARSQPDFSPAVNALQALNKEFNVANAAAIQLHVERVGGRRAGTLLGHHAFASLQDGFDGGETQSGVGGSAFGRAAINVG